MGETINIDIHEDLLASRLWEKLVQNSPLSGHSCIFKVPSTLRRHKEHFFEPSMVSIGPYHWGNKKLQRMKSIKLSYLQGLLDRKPTLETKLEVFIENLKPNLKHLLASYAENVQVGPEEFVELMVIDGCFIIECFRKRAGIIQASVDDPLLNMAWTYKVLVIDLFLLENQLPWFVLDCLYKLTKANRHQEMLSLPQLFHDCLFPNTLRNEKIQVVDQGLRIKHLLDLQRSIILYPGENSNDDDDDDDDDSIVQLFRKGDGIYSPIRWWIPTRCTTALLQAGVRFELGSSDNLMDIKFKKGVLTIPPIQVLDNAESSLRNLIAYDQCDPSLENKITSYAICLDNLIKSSDDLRCLQQKEIITCYLSTEEVSGFFQTLYKDVHLEKY